ncbi:hypothetical protein ASE35_02595 [Lysobacter sp. Root916]|nr:hypothetical protein ASE35_02595 [Lysobacter sp. Root916]
MYRKRGLNTDAQLINDRIAAAQVVHEEFRASELPALLRTAMGRAVPGDLEGLIGEVKKVDPTFDANAGMPEMIILASAILRQVIDDGESVGNRATLATVVAAFGGLRTFEADVELVDHAQRMLTRRQDTGLPVVSTIKHAKRPSLDDDHGLLLAAAQQNNFSSAHAPLKKILDSGPVYTEKAYSTLTLQFNGLVSAHNLLVEQMNAHWWVLNGWSLDAGRSFSDLPAADVAIRVGIELARLTKSSPLGLFAAPALLFRVLEKAGFNPKEVVRLGDVVKASSIDWRQGWASGWLDAADSALLLPVTLAVAMAVDANDEVDWEPRYERASGVSPGASVELLGLARQVYLESLLQPHISA